MNAQLLLASDHDVTDDDRYARYQNALTLLLIAGLAPRDLEIRQRMGAIIQTALKRGEKVSGRWRGQPVTLRPPYIERRRNPELQSFHGYNLRGAVLLMLVLIVAIVIAEKAARAAGVMP